MIYNFEFRDSCSGRDRTWRFCCADAVDQYMRVFLHIL